MARMICEEQYDEYDACKREREKAFRAIAQQWRILRSLYFVLTRIALIFV